MQMEDLRKQFHSLLAGIGFLPKDYNLRDTTHKVNINGHNIGLLKAVLCAGLYPNIIVGPRSLASSGAPKSNDKKVGEMSFRSHTKGDVFLHPATIAFEESRLQSRYGCYHELVRTSKTYVRDFTAVSPLALLLFGGALEVYPTHGVCSVDGWLKFRIDAKSATLIKYLRSKMERLLFEKIVSPQADVFETEEGTALVNSISLLFESESKQQELLFERTDGGEIVRPWTGQDGEYANDFNRGQGRRRPQQQQQQQDQTANNDNSHRSGRNNNSNNRGGGRGGRGGRGSGTRGRGRGGAGGRQK
jgi:hypothetical protein